MSTLNLAEMSQRWESIPAENNKTVYAQFNLYRTPTMRDAKLSLDIFDRERKGKPIMSAPFGPRWCAETRAIWDDLLTNGEPGTKEPFQVFKPQFKDGKRTSELSGQIIYGLDKGGMPYIGVACDNQVYKLPLRTDPNFGRREDYPQAMLVKAAVGCFLDQMKRGEDLVTMSMLVPAEQGEGGGWKNRGGGGGGGKWNKGGGGGGGWNKGGGGGSDNGIDENDLAF